VDAFVNLPLVGELAAQSKEQVIALGRLGFPLPRIHRAASDSVASDSVAGSREKIG